MHKKENNVVGNIRKFIRLDIFGDIYFGDKCFGDKSVASENISWMSFILDGLKTTLSR